MATFGRAHASLSAPAMCAHTRLAYSPTRPWGVDGPDHVYHISMTVLRIRSCPRPLSLRFSVGGKGPALKHSEGQVS